MENKHTPTAEKWFLNLSEKNGDDYMELTLGKHGFSDDEDNKDYMRISGFCSKERALLIHAAPDMIQSLTRISNMNDIATIREEALAAIKKAQPHE